MAEAEWVNLLGVPGESVFDRPLAWALGPGLRERLQSHIDTQIDRVFKLHDDRLLVLIGSLLIEQLVNRALVAFLPGASDFEDDRDFSFSVRIKILRSAKVFPTRILTSADLVRSMRNDFAHGLDIDRFGDLPPGKLQSMRDRVREFGTLITDGAGEADLFRHLVSHTGVALFIYTEHLSGLSRFIRAAEFGKQLQDFVTPQS